MVIEELKDLPPVLSGDEDKCVLKDLVRRLVAFEEEILGASMWQKRGRKTKSRDNVGSAAVERGTGVSSTASFDISAIVTTVSSSVQEVLSEESSPGSSIAMLLSADSFELSVFRDHADSSLDVADPFLLIFAVQGYLHTISRIFKKQASPVLSILAEIQSWQDTYVSSDSMFLALSCASIYIPPDLKMNGNEKLFVEENDDTVMNAFKNGDFEKDGIAKLCVGLVGVSCLRAGNLERTKDSIRWLEQSISGYGGEQAFEAYYALSLIAQACSEILGDSKKHVVGEAEINALIRRVCAFVLKDLIGCFESIGGDIATNLISCTKSGIVPPLPVVRSIVDLDANSIPLVASKRDLAWRIFLACSICFPALARANSYLLLAIFRFFDALEVGCGKGVAIPSILLACQRSGVIDADLEQKMYARYASAFQESVKSKDSTPHELEDFYFVLKGAKWGVQSDMVISFPKGNLEVFDDEGFERTLVASVMSIALLSAVGTSNLGRLAQLEDNVNDESINAVIDLLCNAIALKNDGNTCTMGKIAMGILSSITEPDAFEEENVYSDIQESTDGAAEAMIPLPASAGKKITLNLDGIPSPHPGTLLYGVVDFIAELCCEEAEVEVSREKLLSRALLSVTDISIPDKYAKALVEPVMRENFARKAVVALLSSQVSNRRRAFSEGKSFRTFALKLLQAPSDQWAGFLGDSRNQVAFVERLPDIGVKLSFEDFEKCMTNTWKRCSESSNEELIDCYLWSIHILLVSTSISPKGLAFVREFCIGAVFQDMQAMHKTNVCSAAIDAYVKCLKDVPHAYFQRVDFFSFGASALDLDENAFRALLLLALIKIRYFDLYEQSTTELSNVSSWLSTVLVESTVSPEQMDTLRRILFAFAMTTTAESSVTKHERITAILETGLLSKAVNTRAVLEWLALVLSFWYGCEEGNGDFTLTFLFTVEPKQAQSLPQQNLELFVESAIIDLPKNVSLFCHREKVSAATTNQLHRILKHWSDLGVDKRWLDLVRQSILSCPISPVNEDAFITLASSALQETI